MSQANKEIAKKFINAISNMDGVTIGQLISPDFIAVTTGTSFVSGKRDWDEFAPMIDSMSTLIPNGAKLDIISITAENDRVVCQVEGNATTVTGAPYNNEYMFLVKIKDGKVFQFTEYMDSHLVETLFAPIVASMSNA